MYLYHYYTESLVLSRLVSSLHRHSSSLDTVLHVILNTVITCTIDTRICYSFIYLYHYYMDTLNTVMLCTYTTVTYIHWYTCMDYFFIFFSCGSPFLLHGSLLHVYSYNPITWLFLVTYIDILVTWHEWCWYAMCGTKCHMDLSDGGHL